MGRFRHKSALVAASAIAIGIAIGIAKAQIKVDVKLVRLLVSVKDAKGQLVGSLEKPDFTVYDTGVKQDIAIFEHHTEVPLSVSLLIDTSGSTATNLRYETTSVEKFLRALLREGNPGDSAALYAFDDEVTRLNAFTRREQRLIDSLKELRGKAGTSFYDAIHLASRDLAGRDGRHVIVAVTDGGDTTSVKKYADAFESAQNADAIIYPILVIPITNDAGRNLGGERALETLASGTGGRVFQPMGAGELDDAFTQILRDLRTQYLVAYYPRNVPADAPRFHLVKVELGRKDLRATTRTGYYGDAPLTGKASR
ncbi:MAG: VWA domain-containing protein [Acidobacteriia bacterium]|nr:VWA domain-containing protein [Terriglobia bacterium]